VQRAASAPGGGRAAPRCARCSGTARVHPRAAAAKKIPQTGATAAVPPPLPPQVEELAPLSVKNPLRSPLLWGAWEVAYCSKPTAVGGPLKAGAGPVLFPGQTAKQLLTQPDELVNEVRAVCRCKAFRAGHRAAPAAVGPAPAPAGRANHPAPARTAPPR
jgi:hypothetical protein